MTGKCALCMKMIARPQNRKHDMLSCKHDRHPLHLQPIDPRQDPKPQHNFKLMRGTRTPLPTPAISGFVRANSPFYKFRAITRSWSSSSGAALAPEGSCSSSTRRTSTCQVHATKKFGKSCKIECLQPSELSRSPSSVVFTRYGNFLALSL